jgi:hypothetical protein
MIINQGTFEENLRQNIKFSNSLAFEDENNKAHTDEYIQDRINEKNKAETVEAGFYITDFFLKNNDGDKPIDTNTNYKFATLYEDKTTFVEKLEINDQKTSSIVQNLNRNISKIVKDEMKVLTADTDPDIGYFFMAFPIVISQDVFVVLMNFLDLPFNIEFLFKKNSAKDITTAQLLINEREIRDYNTIITNGLKNLVNPNNLTTKIFHVTDKKASYTDFLKELYSKKFSKFAEITDSKDFSVYKIRLLNNYVVSFELIGENEANLEISPVQSGTRNITYYQNEADARKMYWDKCVDNNSQKDEGENHKLSNYFDIAFDCRYLKVFTFSNYTVGFHVIDYQPAEVYKQIGLTKKLNAGINLFEVYKEVFARKIIELQVEPVS